MKTFVYKYYIVLFFLFLTIVVFALFRNAYPISFFLDDFFFLHIGHAENIWQFLAFFSPIKDYFYRPIPTETFYFLINATGRNLFFAHTVIFGTYLIGLYFLFKVSFHFTKSLFYSSLFVFLYAINYIHIFQLYQLATYIEIVLFTFLTISFYYFLQKRYILAVVFFIFALMSKETSVLYPLFLVVYLFFFDRHFTKPVKKVLAIMIVITGIFLIIYYFSSSHVVEQIDTYKIRLEPRLIINNTVWYILWSLGVPNFIPDYVKSILFKPLPTFWNLLTNQSIRYYLYLLIGFYALLIPTLLTLFIQVSKMQKRKWIVLFCLMFFFFLLFISPTLPIIHRWEVRLTVPLLFFIAFQAYIIYLAFRKGGYLRVISIILFIMYLVLQENGLDIHESSSLISLDSRVALAAQHYMTARQTTVSQYKTIYFIDLHGNSLNGSEELKNMLDDQYFLPLFFPNPDQRPVRAVYSFETPIIPPHSYVIDSYDIVHSVYDSK